MESNLRVGIVGCGAVTELAHLPALAAVRQANVTVLVDHNADRASFLANRFGIPNIGKDLDALNGRVDAVILAVPHALHAGMAVDLLDRKLHVLVEKPMALTTAECDLMIEAARHNKRVLAVGLMRRFAAWSKFVKQVLTSGLLGNIVSFQYREGYVYSWPVQSDFMFKREAAGGGALIDTGAHTLDAVLWWLGDVADFEYFDDARGGVDADCEIHLAMKSGARGFVELSRTRKLPNRVVIHGERGTLEGQPGKVALTVDGFRFSGPVESVAHPNVTDEYDQMISASLKDWIAAILEHRPPLITGEEARRSVALIEACYREKQTLHYPWIRFEVPA